MIIYCYNKCSTCRKAIKFLEETDVKFEQIDYTEQPIPEKTLEKYWRKSGLELKKFFNTSGNLYRETDMKNRLLKMTEKQQLEILSKNPMLVKRPILVLEDEVLVGFNEEKWKERI